MRIIIEGRGRVLMKLDLLPARKTRARVTEVHGTEAAPVAETAVLAHDPHGTTGSQVEQAAEPPAGFGFGVGRVVSINDQRRRHGLDPEP